MAIKLQPGTSQMGEGGRGRREKQVHVFVILFSLAITQSKITPAGRINRDLLQNKLQPARGGRWTRPFQTSPAKEQSCN